MKEIKDFKEVALSSDATVKLVGGTGGSGHVEDVPVTTLGTITNDDDI